MGTEIRCSADACYGRSPKMYRIAPSLWRCPTCGRVMDFKGRRGLPPRRIPPARGSGLGPKGYEEEVEVNRWIDRVLGNFRPGIRHTK